MKHLKIHYRVLQYGDKDAQITWYHSGIIPNKTKLCDGLMMKKGREDNFTDKASDVDCLKCLKKIDVV